jgi:hypothetical protein
VIVNLVEDLLVMLTNFLEVMFDALDDHFRDVRRR